MSESIVLLQKKKNCFFKSLFYLSLYQTLVKKGPQFGTCIKKKTQNTFWIIVYIYFFFMMQPRDQDTYKITIFILFFHF